MPVMGGRAGADPGRQLRVVTVTARFEGVTSAAPSPRDRLGGQQRQQWRGGRCSDETRDSTYTVYPYPYELPV